MPTKKAVKKASKKKASPRAAKSRALSAEDKEEKAYTKNLDTVLKEMTTVEPEKAHFEQTVQVQCPYCGEVFEIHLTSEEVGQTMTEDCSVCCKPISLHVQLEDDELQVNTHRS